MYHDHICLYINEDSFSHDSERKWHKLAQASLKLKRNYQLTKLENLKLWNGFRPSLQMIILGYCLPFLSIIFLCVIPVSGTVSWKKKKKKEIHTALSSWGTLVGFIWVICHPVIQGWIQPVCNHRYCYKCENKLSLCHFGAYILATDWGYKALCY